MSKSKQVVKATVQNTQVLMGGISGSPGQRSCCPKEDNKTFIPLQLMMSQQVHQASDTKGDFVYNSKTGGFCQH